MRLLRFCTVFFWHTDFCWAISNDNPKLSLFLYFFFPKIVVMCSVSETLPSHILGYLINIKYLRILHVSSVFWLHLPPTPKFSHIQLPFSPFHILLKQQHWVQRVLSSYAFVWGSTRDQTLKENCLSLSSLHQLSITPQFRVAVPEPHLHAAMLTCLFLCRSCADRYCHHEFMSTVVPHIQKSFTQALPVLQLLKSSILPSWALSLKKRVCGIDAHLWESPP